MSGSSRVFAISKLPHGKQTNFAPTSAVPLISDLHSELEGKVLSLDNSERMEICGPKENPGCYSHI